MYKVTIATGIDELDNDLKKVLKSTQLPVGYREFLLKQCNDIVIISEHLTGTIDFKTLLFELKKKDKRIILLMDTPQNSLFVYALKIGIYDIICDGEKAIECSIILNVIDNPKKISDYSRYAEIFSESLGSSVNNNLPIKAQYIDSEKKSIEQEKTDGSEKTVSEKEIQNKVIIKKVTDTKVITNEVVVKEYISFNKIVINIWGNPEFGCELAYTVAALSGKSVLLMDCNMQMPLASVYLGVSPFTEYNIKNSSGIEVLLSLNPKNDVLSEDTFKKVATTRSDFENLFIITGNPKIDDNLLFPTEETINSFKNIISTANKLFDVVIILSNESATDPYTLCAIAEADYTLAARRQNIDDLNVFYSQYHYLKNKGTNKIDRLKFVAYEYCSESIEDIAVFHKDLFDLKDLYLGHITFSDKRLICKNRKKLYASKMSEQNVLEYKNLLRFFNIVSNKRNFLNPFRAVRKLISK